MYKEDLALNNLQWLICYKTMIWLGWVLWLINHRWLFNAKSIFILTVLFRAIQFSISTQISSIGPIDRTLSGAITPGQSEPGSDDNKGVIRISKSSSITGASPSDSLSYTGHPLGSGTPLRKCSRCILQPQSTGPDIPLNESKNLLCGLFIIIIIIIIIITKSRC